MNVPYHYFGMLIITNLQLDEIDIKMLISLR